MAGTLTIEDLDELEREWASHISPCDEAFSALLSMARDAVQIRSRLSACEAAGSRMFAARVSNIGTASWKSYCSKYEVM